jgi:hypothetical protein
MAIWPGRTMSNEFRAVLDFVLVARESPDERISGIIEPLDDIDKLATNLVEKPHGSLNLR